MPSTAIQPQPMPAALPRTAVETAELVLPAFAFPTHAIFQKNTAPTEQMAG